MNVRRKVLVTLPYLYGRQAPYLTRLEKAGFEIAFNDRGRRYTEDELVEILPGCFATIAGSEPYTERVLTAARDLRVIARWGVGYDRIDVASATRHGVAVAMTFGANHEAVADHAFALIGGLACALLPTHGHVAGGDWLEGFHGSLWKATVGIIGLGRIGRAVARRCKGFEMRILANDIAADTDDARRNGIALVPLEPLIRESDFVTLHAPLTDETRDLMNRERLAWMKPTAFLINTARGELIDEDALFEALSAGVIAGAGLDVFRREPPTDSPLLRLGNVLFTPHSATQNDKSEALVADRCVDSILAIARGEDPGGDDVLNPEVLHCPAATGKRNPDTGP